MLTRPSGYFMCVYWGCSAAAKPMVIGPKRPKNIAAVTSSLPAAENDADKLKLSLLPMDKPTVPKADVISNKILPISWFSIISNNKVKLTKTTLMIMKIINDL